MAKVKNKVLKKEPVEKITSIGRYAKPTNKHKRRNFKPYRAQGGPRGG